MRQPAIFRRAVLAATMFTLSGLASAVLAHDFSIVETQLQLETRGRIMIYDGLKDTQIAQAMETQFDRIQSMMFIRTVATDSEGEILRDEETDTVVVEDDGC